MTDYVGNIDNLLQGVSQQPRKDRRGEQVGVQENCSSLILKGLGKRPGTTEEVDTLIIENFSEAAKYTYDRGDGEERYTLVCTSDLCSVINLNTGEITPTVINDVNYLQDFSGEGKDPKEYLKFYTIADTTLVVNTTASPTMNNTSTQDDWQGIIYCKSANYGFTYQVIIDSVIVATYVTPSTVAVGTGNVSKTIHLKTSDIITNLWTGGIQAWATAEGVTAVLGINEIILTKETTSDGYELSVYDDNNNNDLKAIGFSTTNYDDLPVKCITGLKVKVTGTDEQIENDYYAEFIGDVDKSTGINVPESGDTVVWTVSGSATTLMMAAYTVNTAEVALPTDTEIVSVSMVVRSYIQVLSHRYPINIAVTLNCWDGTEWFSNTVNTSSADYNVSVNPEVYVGRVFTKFYISVTYSHPYGYGKDVYWSYSTASYTYTIPEDLGNNIVQGHWAEAVGFNTDQTINPDEMPHTIKRLSDGSFLMEQIEWVDRKSGDDESNPKPSFIDSKISAIGVYQDRLLFLTNENTVASVTYDHYNLFSDSVIQSSKDDPIDTTSSDNQVTNLEHMLVFNAALMIFSNKAQFVHSGDIAFTSDAFSLASKSRYSTDITSPPVASANSIFFPFNFGVFTGIREYKIDVVSGVSSAEEITHHIQHYLPGECLQMASTTDYNILLVRVENDPKAIYVYEWFDAGNERKQSSWHRWDFPVDVEYISIIQNKLYIWYAVTDGVRYVTLDLSDTDDISVDFPIRLDYKSIIQATSVDDNWQVSRDLDSLYGTWDDVVVLGATDSGIEGAATSWTPLGDDSGVLVPKNALPNSVGTPYFYIGRKYISDIEITNPYVRDQQGKPKTYSKTTLKSMSINCSDTGYLEVIVTKLNSLTYTKRFTSRIINSPEYQLNSSAPLQTVGIKVPIRYDADRCKINIKSDSHLPFHISDIDWSGKYKEKGRRTI